MGSRDFVIIGANEFQDRMIVKANQMGLTTHVFAWREGAVGASHAARFYPISIMEKDEILAVCRDIQPAGIGSIASDLAVQTVIHVARALSLPCNPPAYAQRCTNKYEMRRAFQAAGVYVPRYLRVTEDPATWRTDGMCWPLIVKPTDRSGSRAITKVTDKSQLPQAVAAACSASFEHQAMLEEFVDGPEYSCEAISYQGRHTPLAITQKFTTGAPHFIETGHRQPSDIPADRQAEIKAVIVRALDALHVETGASHSEFRLAADGRVFIVEIGARMGGDWIGSDLVEASTGLDFLKMTIQCALGQAPDMTASHPPRRAEVRFIFSQADVDTLHAIQAATPNRLAWVSPIEEIGSHPVVDSGSRYGSYLLVD